MYSSVTMHKAEKYAVRMSALCEETKSFLLQSFGCARKVYNLYVDFYYDALERNGYTSGDDIPEVKLPEVTTFKKTYSYLRDVDSLALCNAKIDFERAVRHYREDCDHKTYTKRALRRDASGKEKLSFRGLKGMPKFHAKARGDFSYKTNCQYPSQSGALKTPTVRLEGSTLYLPKIKKGIPLTLHRPFPEGAIIGNVTVTMDIDGKMYASIGYTYTVCMNMSVREAVASGDTSITDKLSFLGLDYSQKDFYVDSEGRTANYPHYYRKSEEKLARLQRKLSRMEEDSSNYKKMLRRIQKLHIKIRNQRLDFVRKEASYLASRYDVVAVEDIDLRAMGGALKLGKNLHDNGFGMFRSILARKLEAKGTVLVKVDRWYASTKTCRYCGYKNDDVTLGVSEWVCPSCGAHHFRDHNAAVNIREEGKRIFIQYFSEWLEKDTKARARAEALSAGRRKKKTGTAA